MFALKYGLADRLLHRLALGSSAMAELSFDLDQKASRATLPAWEAAQGRHVFVAGLARAGTTILLRHLHATGVFRSLTYRDMPFPLAPNLWKRASTRWRREGPVQLRAHSDGIAVDADSPEALEELFWRVHAGSDYIRPDRLLPHAPDQRMMTLFQRYVAAILASGEAGQSRYLSKNNNNILRLSALRHSFPAALFIMPFRHPATHALSLWRQHRHFSALQADMPFVRSYMDWLAHHEFGQGHRPFVMSGQPLPKLSPDRPDYWLALWIAVYRDLAKQVDDRQLPVCYEDMCTDPRVWAQLVDRLDLPEHGAAPDFRLMGSTPQPDCFDAAQLEQAEEIYRHLRRRSAVDRPAPAAPPRDRVT